MIKLYSKNNCGLGPTGNRPAIICMGTTVVVPVLRSLRLGDGLLLLPGLSTNLDNGRARAYRACRKCGWGLVGYIFSLAYHYLFLSPSVLNGWMSNLWFKGK